MLADAEKYAKEDEAQKEKIAARNQLESYVFGVKQAVEETGKISNEEKESCLSKCKDTLNWLDNNQLADKEEYEFKLKEIQKETQPIMMKIHGAGGGNGPQAGPGAQAKGPTVEEVD